MMVKIALVEAPKLWPTMYKDVVECLFTYAISFGAICLKNQFADDFLYEHVLDNCKG